MDIDNRVPTIRTCMPSPASETNDSASGYPADADSPNNEDSSAWCDSSTQWDTGDYGSPGTDNDDCTP